MWKIIKIIHIFIGEILYILNIIHIFVLSKEMKDMAQERKYRIGCSGSGWGIWDADGHKVMSCYSHFDAVEKLYQLMGWRFDPAKYRRNY